MSKRAMFVQPMFNYREELWRAMIFGWNPDNPSEGDLLIGFGFKDKGYAKKFFDLMRSYNNEQDVDTENNIRLSFIIESPEEYSTFLYPSPERESVNEFLEGTKEELGQGVESLIMQMVICKFFPYGEQSTLKKFRNIYAPGRNLELTAFLVNEQEGTVDRIEDIPSIFKKDILLTNRKLLSKNDLEYQHMKGFKR